MLTEKHISELNLLPLKNMKKLNLGIVEDVINKWPCIIEQADDLGWTPLNLAAHLDNDKIIKLILQKETSIAYAKNKEGLSALHIAAKEGNLGAIRELITACPDIYELLDNRGQTAIHAAAESGQLIPEFKGLMTLFSEQNEEGNTPLYLAVIKGHFLSFWFMESAKGVDLNATNKEGFNIMDKLFLARASFGANWRKNRIKPFWEKGARPSLRGAMRIRNLDPTGEPEQAGIRNSDPRRKPEQAGDGDGDDEGRSVSDFVKRVSETNLLVATLIATVSFTAAFTVPGGYNQSGNVGEGLAVLWKNTAFRVFLIANTLAFGLSTTSVFVHFLGSSAITGNVFQGEVVQHAASFTNWSVGALLVAFISGTYTVNCLTAKPKLVWDDDWGLQNLERERLSQIAA
uniref:PGG domain-containing protein n=1 Tax=Quercus lobata TaxID=97700 RepID=A0A7N2R0X9_QUELO